MNPPCVAGYKAGYKVLKSFMKSQNPSEVKPVLAMIELKQHPGNSQQRPLSVQEPTHFSIHNMDKSNGRRMFF